MSPPPLSSASSTTTTTTIGPSTSRAKARNIKNLSLPSPKLALKPASSAADAQVPGSRASRVLSNAALNAHSVDDTIKPESIADISEQMATLELGVEFKLDLRAEDLKTLKPLGAGNGGTVNKVMHIPTKTIMAKKVIHVEKKKAVRKQILRELQIMHDCSSPYIVSFYGAFMVDMEICMCMEYMDCGSLDRISKKIGGPIPVDIMSKIAHAVVSGLTYLYLHHQIIHRDVKPSNILLSHTGALKLCDFGVSGELINSIADTFVGTSTYMSPERIQGSRYTVKSDVWSLGITLFELGGGQAPWGSGGGVLELLQQIVNEPPPQLPEGKDYQGLDKLIGRCLVKDPDKRPRPEELMKDPFIVAAAQKEVDLATWAQAFLSPN